MDRDKQLRFQAPEPELKPATSIEELLTREWSLAQSIIDRGKLDEYLDALEDDLAILANMAAIPVPVFDPENWHASIPDDESDTPVRYKVLFEGSGTVVDAALGTLRVGTTPLETWSNGIGFDLENPLHLTASAHEKPEAVLSEINARWSDAVTQITEYNAGLADRFRAALAERRDLLASGNADT
jgi:hypothetical protein